MTNIYEEILANIDADKKAWCKGSWYSKNRDGSLSACLVQHVDIALGTAYVKPSGKPFISKDPRKWNRRERILSHLAMLLPEQFRFYDDDEAYEPVELTRENVANVRAFMDEVPEFHRPLGRGWQAEEDLTAFNDRVGVTKAQVKALLKKAAKRHPED